MPVINTTEVTELIGNTKRLQKIKQQIGSLRYQADHQPKLRMPTGPDAWEELGKQIGMAGLEASMIWDAILTNPSEHELETIKKLLLVGKLTHTKPTIDFQARCKSSQDYFDGEMQRYQHAKAKIAELETELQEVLTESQFTDMRSSWQVLMDDVRKYVESHDNVVEKFTGLDRAFFELLKTNSKYVRTEVSETDSIERAVVVWEKVRDDLNIEHIHTILRKWATILEQGK